MMIKFGKGYEKEEICGQSQAGPLPVTATDHSLKTTTKQQ